MIFRIVVIWLCWSSSLIGQTVTGDTIRVSDNTMILKVWGSHYQRGYSHGYLLGDKIKLIFQEYILKSVFYNNPANYQIVRNYFISNFSMEDKYLQEAGAMIKGMEDAGISIYDSTLQRNVDSMDILMVNAIDEIREINKCSSMSSWGSATVNDPGLNGDVVITRLMDWQMHFALVDNHLILVSIPEESDEQSWVSVTYPGLIAALSAMNESGVGAFKNVGNPQNHPNMHSFHPVLLSVRNGLEMNDYNQDGQCNPIDVVQAIQDKYQFGSSVIHVVSKVCLDSHALIVECDNEHGMVTRDVLDNTAVPGENLVATNHHRKLVNPVYCVRYDEIADSLNNSADITTARSWTIMAAGGGYSNNNQMMQYIPSTGTLMVATATVDSAAYLREPYVFDLSDLFTVTGIEEGPVVDNHDLLEINFICLPQNNSYQFTIELEKTGWVELKIFQINGRLVENVYSGNLNAGQYSFRLPDKLYNPGVYFCSVQMETVQGDRVKQVKKIIFH